MRLGRPVFSSSFKANDQWTHKYIVIIHIQYFFQTHGFDPTIATMSLENDLS